MSEATDNLKIKSHKADKNRGVSNTPLHKHQLDSTLKQYCGPVLKLLALLLRPKDHYQVPVTEELEEALNTLQTAL